MGGICHHWQPDRQRYATNNADDLIPARRLKLENRWNGQKVMRQAAADRERHAIELPKYQRRRDDAREQNPARGSFAIA